MKDQLRKHFRTLRSHIHESVRRQSAQSAAIIFAEHPVFSQSEQVAIYLPVKDEFDSYCMIERIWQANKNCYLPVLSDVNTMRFHRYHSQDRLQLNRYAIPEPVNTVEISPEQLDLVILPLLAFDSLGHRLGAGGGYYDRTFQFLHQQSINKPMLIGLAYASQQADLLPADIWDIRLDGVVTEKELLLFENTK